MKDDEFRQQFADARPLKQDRAEIQRSNRARADYAARREAAVREAEHDNALDNPVEMVDPYAVVGFKRPGIQEGVYKKLRLGQYEIQARLDLHGMTVEEARKQVYRFVLDCLHYELRVAVIVHGKGARGEKKAVLKSHTISWLEQMEQVMAIHSAQPHHGGAGALYVLLKKSDSAKQKNREKFGGR